MHMCIHIVCICTLYTDGDTCVDRERVKGVSKVSIL